MRTACARRAASLIEVAVALAVLAIGLCAVVDLLGGSRRTARQADERLQAMSLGHLKLEELRAGIAASKGPFPAAFPAGDAQPLRYPSQGFQPFEQNPLYEWQALWLADKQTSRPAQLSVEVRRAGGASQDLYRIGGLSEPAARETQP